LDTEAGKKFNVTERVGLECRAEGFNLFSRHNDFLNPTDSLYCGPNPIGVYPTRPLSDMEEKDGLDAHAIGDNYDECGLISFSLRASS
jgi:hypothetical protein